MKHNYLFLFCAAVLFTSCAQMYNYVQVFETTSSSPSIKNENGGVIYEDNTCAVYYRFWAEGGDAGFSIYNKTDKIMYIDLSKSFFIRNGAAFDYYKDRTVSETRTNTIGTQVTNAAAVYGNMSKSTGVSATYAGKFGSLPFTPYDPILTSANVQQTESYGALRYSALANSYASATSASVSIKEPKILAIPPHAAKIIAEYSINDKILLFCDLDRYPENNAYITFNKENSPVSFSNYITYTLGDSAQEIVIENDFYISKITNYAKPVIYEYVEKTKPCQNLTSDDSKDYKTKYPTKVYNRILKIDPSNCFYLEYNIQSKRKLYKGDSQLYYYNALYDGYVTEAGNDGWIGYEKRLLNPFAKPE